MRAQVASVLLAASASTAADEWPQWRGPQGTGVSLERGLPTRWSPSEITWKARLGGLGISSPIVWGDRVFVTSQVGRAALRPGNHPAMDPKTGERVWQERVDGIFTASPVGADGKIYLVSETGDTIVLQAGPAPKVLARNSVGERTVATPAVSGGQIFIRSDDSIIAVGDTP
jgi:outer membrane protein assembly factor BamB